ncbi:MAG TPA: protease complex subunit PrcB family protein [Gemmatimonas sp.]|nr:protease complex subunit PrcB family protein [Gemmatimonas sp.]
MTTSRAAWLTVAAVASSIIGCRKPEPVSPDSEGTFGPSPSSSQSLVVTRLRSGPESFTYSSSITESRRVVIRDDAAWRTAWAEMWARTGPSVPPLPAIDFSRDMIILAALGQRNSGGYSITIDSASRATSGAIVWVSKPTPGKCGTLAALTQPVDLARVPKVDGNVDFREREAVSPGCM